MLSNWAGRVLGTVLTFRWQREFGAIDNGRLLQFHLADQGKRAEYLGLLDETENWAQALGCPSVLARVGLFRAELQTGVMTTQRFVEHAAELEKHIWIDTRLLCFESIPPASLNLYNGTFGDSVSAAFPSALPDIREANTSFALGRWTACVFHAMRAAEAGLRALALDRSVSFPDRPIEFKEWANIIDALNSKVKDLRKVPPDSWTSYEIKEAQIGFYNDAVNHANGFNEVWRRHVSHARGAAGIYDEGQAKSARERVEAFLQTLALVISEDVQTEEFWK